MGVYDVCVDEVVCGFGDGWVVVGFGEYCCGFVFMC